MKKYIIFIVALLCVSMVSAASYELTPSIITPGSYEGEYYYEDTLMLGATTNPGFTSNTPAVYVSGETGHIYGLFYRGDDLTFPLIVTSTETSDTVYGLYSNVANGFGVYARSDSSSVTHAAVKGYASDDAPAILGKGEKYSFYADGSPTYGLYVEGADTYGVKVADSGMYGGHFTADSYGVMGLADNYGGYFSGGLTGVYGISSGSTATNCGVSGYSSDSGYLGYLGCPDYGLYTPNNAYIGGDLYLGGSTRSADVAEYFFGKGLQAGDVVSLDPSVEKGVVKTTKKYDKRVAGIVSTDPTLIMGAEADVPIALTGVVPVNVIGDVAVGDLLTPSSVAGHAMTCDDYQACQGSFVGKAMESSSGKGVVMALVMLG
jgi:hypothetical protein